MYIVSLTIAGTTVIDLLVQSNDALLACNDVEESMTDVTTSYFKEAKERIEQIKRKYLLRGYFLEYCARRVSKDDLPVGMSGIPYIQQIVS